jgi:hypothetical protein
VEGVLGTRIVEALDLDMRGLERLDQGVAPAFTRSSVPA